MNNKKQTAVDWLIGQIKRQMEDGDTDLRTTLHYCEQAKEIESSIEEEKDKELENLKAKIKVLENLNPHRSRRISNEFIEPIYNSTEPTCVICGQFKNMCICRTPTF